MHIAAIGFSSPMTQPLLARAVRAGSPSPADDLIGQDNDLLRDADIHLRPLVERRGHLT